MSTVPERESIAADGTAYVVTRKEVRPRACRASTGCSGAAGCGRGLATSSSSADLAELPRPAARAGDPATRPARVWDSDSSRGGSAILALRARRALPGARLAARLHAPPQPPGGVRPARPARTTSRRVVRRQRRPGAYAGSAARHGLLARSRSTPPTSTARSSTSSSTATAAPGGHVGRPGLLRLRARRVRAGRRDLRGRRLGDRRRLRHGPPGQPYWPTDRRGVPGPGRPRLRARRRGDRGAEPAWGGRLSAAGGAVGRPIGAPIMRSMAPRDPQSSVDERGSDPTQRRTTGRVDRVRRVRRRALPPDFIASIERQGAAPGVLEVVAVDDGSTDGSLAGPRGVARPCAVPGDRAPPGERRPVRGPQPGAGACDGRAGDVHRPG